MKTILIVDDDLHLLSGMQEILSLELEELGIDHHILTAGNGEEGLQIALEEVPDFIILDVMMPKMNGYEVYRNLQQHEATAAIPVLFESGHDAEKMAETIISEFGLTKRHILSAPFDTDNFIAVTLEFLGIGTDP